MQISIKHLILVSLFFLLLGAFVDQNYISRSSEKITTKTKEDVKTQEVEQKKDQDVITTKEIIRPDGSKEINTTEVKTEVQTDKKSIDDQKNTTVVDQKASNVKDRYFSLNASVPFNSGLGGLTNPTYGISVGQRLIGPIYGEVGVYTSQRINGSIIIEIP